MFGISLLPIIPLRAEPSSKSEMVSQLLFGEKYKILHQQPNWVKIENETDNYIGWINDSQLNIVTETEWLNLINPITVNTFPYFTILVNNLPMYISPGSFIYLQNNFKITGFNFEINYQKQALKFENLAKQYLNTPYLWGGKTPWGIDCSGFTQIVYKQFGVNLKRDAFQQAEQGEILGFLAEAQLGDLAFFDNEEGKIIHVGILLNNETIIHASGRVKLDKIDNHGIINSETKKYSHKLRIIKRVKIS
jgi:hypothetical protein